MSYMDALWIKIRNSYSKWLPLALIQSLSLSGRSSIELRNSSTGKSAAAFRRNRFKLSVLGCLFLQHPLPWIELELPAVLSPSTQGMDNQQLQETNVPDFISTSDWPSVSPYLNLLDYKLWSKASRDGLQVEIFQYWNFKAVSSEGSCRFSSWCVE